MNDKITKICVWEPSFPESIKWAAEVEKEGGIATQRDLTHPDRVTDFLLEYFGSFEAIRGGSFFLLGCIREYCLGELATGLLEIGAANVNISRTRSISLLNTEDRIQTPSHDQEIRNLLRYNRPLIQYYREGKLDIVLD
jgi:hypothetical protein